MKEEFFNNITFDEETHTYQYNNKRADVSVTGLIHMYSQEFDEEVTAERVANKRGVSVEVILDEWRTKRDYSCVKGNEIHKFAQGLWKGEEYNTDYTTIETRFVEQLKADLEVLKPQAIAFYNDYADMLELVKDEQYIYDEDYDIAGSIDLLCKNKYTNEFVIVDFKSNDNFDKKAYDNMKVPLHELADSNLSHYSLQLEIYKQIFEKNTAEKVECTFIVHFDLAKDNYTIIEPLNVKKEVKKILEMRRRKNMNSVGILLMGASGTGKTTSFRNLPPEETAIINVTNKPMPFKNSGIKIVSTTDYTAIMKAISETKKRIIIIDDSSYLMSFENFEKANIKSYDKFVTMAQNYYKLIETIRECKGEKIVYLVTHEETDEVTQLARPKTIGKMLSQQLVIEGLFSIVLRSLYKNGEYIFQTQNDGTSVCKSPMDMFTEKEIPNDLAEVDKIVREYYEFKPITEKLEDKKEEESK